MRRKRFLLRAGMLVGGAILLYVLPVASQPCLDASCKAPQQPPPPAACCRITAVDKPAGLVLAKVNSTGQSFQFRTKLTSALKVGQAVWANLSTKGVSLDGRNICCEIVWVGPPGVAKSPGGAIASDNATPRSESTSGAKTTTQPAKKGSSSGDSSGKDFKAPPIPVVTVPEGTTAGAIRGATAGGQGGSAQQGPVIKRLTIEGINMPKPHVSTSQLPPPNPNHLPDLVPYVGSFAGECSYSPSAGQTCENTCTKITIKIVLGIRNTTKYAASGSITVQLSDGSSVVRSWTVSGLAGNGTAVPGYFSYPWQCAAPGTISMSTGPSSNYWLSVQAPGVSELDPNNKVGLYIPPYATIGP